MAVYRLPPVAQWYQPHALLDARSVDAPNPQPLPELYHLRRRPDFEVDQQPRHLLDVSVITTVDAPIPLPDPPLYHLRARHPYETVQQPQRLLDINAVASVDDPPRRLALQLYERAAWFAGQQARGLPVDVLAPVVVADNPTGNITQANVFRPYEYQAWLQKDPLDVSVTQGVDSPPGFGRQQQPPPPAARGAQWDQLVPGNFDIAATIPFTVQAFTQPPRPDRAPWLQQHPLDVSITQSVDSPPGYFRLPLPAPRPGSGAQWRQAAPGLISAPDAPNPTFNPWVYARQAAETQAWQKTVPVWHLVTVDSPPLSGPYPTAPYRRPRYTPPVPMPKIAALVALPFAPSSLNPAVTYYRPGPAVYARPGIVKLYRPDTSPSARPAPDRNDRPGA